MYVYKEEAIMSFANYMVYIGGLISLWFGTNGKDFIIWIIDSYIWVWFANRFKKLFSRNKVLMISVETQTMNNEVSILS